MEKQISQWRHTVSTLWYANNLPKADVDIVDKKANGKAKLSESEVSVFRRLPIIRPEGVIAIGGNGAFSSGGKNSL